MARPLEYHRSVKRFVPRSLAFLSPLLFLVFFVRDSSAQHSASASAPGASFSSGVSFSSSHVSAPTAVGVASFSHPSQPSPASGTVHSTPVHHPPNWPRGSNATPQAPICGSYYRYPCLYAVPMPYTLDFTGADQTDAADADDDADYQGGPTVFDRRGSGPDSYVPPASSLTATSEETGDSGNVAQSTPAPAPEPPAEPTLLVFKDGHQLEVANYAIVGQTLYDLTPGHRRRISLADLDLPATQEKNDDRGVIFQMPSSAGS